MFSACVLEIVCTVCHRFFPQSHSVCVVSTIFSQWHSLSLSHALAWWEFSQRGLAMHPSNHPEMWNHVNLYTGKFNTLENVSWELLYVLPGAWAVCSEQCAVNSGLVFYGQWIGKDPSPGHGRAGPTGVEKHAGLNRHFHNGSCLCDRGKSAGVFVCVWGGSAARTHTPCVAAIVILRCIEQCSLILISADLSQVFGFSSISRKQTITVPTELH